MKTKQKIQEGLDGFKRMDKTYGLVNRAVNHIYDAYRELEHAISTCDDPNLRDELEKIKQQIGFDREMGYFFNSEKETIINQLQNLLGNLKVGVDGAVTDY